MQLLHFFSDNPGLLIGGALRLLLLSVISMAIALVLGIPIGAMVGHARKFSFLVINGGNALRALPTLAIISILIGLIGLNFFNILIALVVLGFPLILTNTYSAVAQIEPSMVEAARGMGMKEWQILLRVEIPNGVPLIMAGVRTATVYVIATSYLATIAGYSNTLGDIINNQASFTIWGVLAATIVSVVLALLGEGLLGVLQRVMTPRGVRLESDTRRGRPQADLQAEQTEAPAEASVLQ